MEKDEDQLILSILTNLNANYSVFVSTFQIVRLTAPNWKIPTLDAFIQYLTSENDKLIQMGIIQYPKDQALVARGDKVANDKWKQRDESPMKKEQSKDPSGLKISKNNDKGKTLCSYYGRGFHLEISFMRRQLDEMTLLLKKHKIIAPASTMMVEHIEDT